MRNKKEGEEKRQWLYSLVFFFAGKFSELSTASNCIILFK